MYLSMFQSAYKTTSLIYWSTWFDTALYFISGTIILVIADKSRHFKWEPGLVGKKTTERLEEERFPMIYSYMTDQLCEV